jgi:hypothetical protein
MQMSILDKLISKESRKSQAEDAFMYTEEQLMARLKFFIGVCLTLTLTGIVFVVLYSIIFVTQPLNAISPIDQKFFEMLVPISTFLTGILSGIMLAGNDKDLKAKAMDAAAGAVPNARPASPLPPAPSGGGFGAPGLPRPNPGLPPAPSFPPAPSMPAGMSPMPGTTTVMGMPPPPPPPGIAPVNAAPPGPPNLPPPPVF